VTLRDSLTNALQGALSPLIADLGCRIAIYRPTVVKGSDKGVSRTYAFDPAWTSLDVVFAPGTGESGAGASESVAKPFGVRSSAKATITILRTASGHPSVAAFDGIKILDGPYAGYTWLAEADGVVDLIGLSQSVAVIAAPSGAIP
jgi:hypothetical protein